MVSRVSFSGDHHALREIAEHHQDLEASLRVYFSTASPTFVVRFGGYSLVEVADELETRIDEADLTSSLAILASLEAAFRIDYLLRCYRKRKDALSRVFREIYKAKKIGLKEYRLLAGTDRRQAKVALERFPITLNRETL